MKADAAIAEGAPATTADASSLGQSAATPAPPLGRRSDLDWLRVIAFGLLILFHVGLVYAPFDWHIHSRFTAPWMREGILVTGPWRLTLLFLISGAALSLMSRKLTASQVVGARFARLLPPALFGVLILVPPQAFIEAFDKGGWTGDVFGWWVHQFSPAELAVSGVPLNHMWFVLYILVYSVITTVLVALPWVKDRLADGLQALLGGPWALLIPIAYLTLVRQRLFLHYGISNHISTDWYNHAVSYGAFLLGFLLVSREGFWRALMRWRWASLVVAAVALPTLMVLEAVPETTPEAWWTSLVFSADQWATIAAVLGFGAQHLRNRDGPVLRYLTQAVFPCYLAHQTLLVAIMWWIKPLNLPAAIEPVVLVTGTVGGCLMIYEVVRRINLIRPLWGLKPLPKKVRAKIATEPVLQPTPTPPGSTPDADMTAEAA